MNLEEIFNKEITKKEKIIYYHTLYKEEANEEIKKIILNKLKELLEEYASWMN